MRGGLLLPAVRCYARFRRCQPGSRRAPDITFDAPSARASQDGADELARGLPRHGKRHIAMSLTDPLVKDVCHLPLSQQREGQVSFLGNVLTEL